MKKLLPIVLAVALAASMFALGACKQKQGERCQVNDDCEDPLVCAPATLTCEGGMGNDPVDALVPDAPPGDAAIDAPPDAPLDAR